MKILVIEDKELHQESAWATLGGHEVTVAKKYDDALDALVPGCNFDVVLSDLMMPMSRKTLSFQAYKPEEQVPYGLILALRAAACGVKYVAVVTDTNHHKGAMSAALDQIGLGNGMPEGWNCSWDEQLRPNFTINDARCMFVHSPFTEDGAKDWGQVLKALTS